MGVRCTGAGCETCEAARARAREKRHREGLAQAWDEGHQRGLRDADLQHESDNPYREN